MSEGRNIPATGQSEDVDITMAVSQYKVAYAKFRLQPTAEFDSGERTPEEDRLFCKWSARS